MQFIRLPKAIYIAERLLPEQVVDWMDTKSVQNIDIMFIKKLRVDILIAWVIEWSNIVMFHRRTFRNCTYRACAMRLEHSWLVLDNPRPRPSQGDNIVCEIHQHNSISSRDQLCQDSAMGTAWVQSQNAMPCQYFWHFSWDRRSAQRGSRRAL
jgi:hypothetical protein